jgi:hypothetical protein
MEKHLKPIVDYLAARDLAQAGKSEEAAEKLEGVFGSTKPNEFLRSNLKVALDPATPAGEIVLDGVYGEMKRVQRGRESVRI